MFSLRISIQEIFPPGLAYRNAEMNSVSFHSSPFFMVLRDFNYIHTGFLPTSNGDIIDLISGIQRQ